MDGIIGKKIGMTQFFDENGHQVPVTVIEVGPCSVVQRKREESDGYDAVQLGYVDQKPQRLSKPLQGHFKKGGVDPKRILREVRVDASSELKEGDALSADMFEGVDYVDVIGTTKGRGFQGVVKRHGMGGGRASHGSSSHRGPGSIGSLTTEGKVTKNKRLPGHMGNVQITAQNLKVVQVRNEDQAILVRGAVPGPNGGFVFVRKALKKAAKAS